MDVLQSAAHPEPPARKRRGYEVGVPSESCSAEMLGLPRFASAEKLFAQAQKSPIERLLNPFGDPWSTRKFNAYIPVMTGSTRGNLRRQNPDLSHPVEADSRARRDYATYVGRASSAFHYDETDGRLSADMPRFREMKQAFREAWLTAPKFIAYTVANFDDGLLFARGSGVPESAYVHFPESSLDPADRLKFCEAPPLDAEGFVFDIRRPEVRDMIAAAIAKAMRDNDVDAVLVDYAARAYAFGLPSLIDTLPVDWCDTFQQNQRDLLQRIHVAVGAAGKMLFINGVMLDSIAVTDPGLVAMFGKCADGLFWEQPFRWEWRNYSHDGVDYYERLGQFFDAIFAMKKQLIVKIGTYRFHATEDIEPSWRARFGATNHGIERHLAAYFTAFFLLYCDRRRTHLFYTHPTELSDIFSSEAHFQIWERDIGDPTSARTELAPHLQMRAFERGLVFVNNTLEPVCVSPADLPAKLAKGFSALELAPLSGVIWLYPDAWRRGVLTRLRQWLRPRQRLMALRQKAVVTLAKARRFGR
jgi:hypothetical protein